jgi:broad specificity phosphatase PhoE
MTRLLLIRHGVTDWNAEKKLQGHANIELNDMGRKLLARRKIPAIYSNFQVLSSPLKRAVETARILTGKQPAIIPDLIEMDWGDWEGKTIAQLRSHSPDIMAENEAKGLDMCPPAGESPRDVQRRLLPWLQSLDQDTLAVTHKGVIRAIKSLAYGWDMKAKSKIRFDWTAAHLFDVNAHGQIMPVEVNISLEEE